MIAAMADAGSSGRPYPIQPASISFLFFCAPAYEAGRDRLPFFLKLHETILTLFFLFPSSPRAVLERA